MPCPDFTEDRNAMRRLTGKPPLEPPPTLWQLFGRMFVDIGKGLKVGLMFPCVRTRRRLPLGVLPATAALLAACSSTGPGPLGDGGQPGTQCVPGREGHPVTMGIYSLENAGSSPATIQSVTLPSAHGLRMTKPWVIPVWVRPGKFYLVGAGLPYPPTIWPTWKQHRPADGAVIKPHSTLNLVFGLTRTTSSSGRAAGPQVTYSDGGNSYNLQESISLVVSARRSC